MLTLRPEQASVAGPVDATMAKTLAALAAATLDVRQVLARAQILAAHGRLAEAVADCDLIGQRDPTPSVRALAADALARVYLIVGRPTDSAHWEEIAISVLDQVPPEYRDAVTFERLLAFKQRIADFDDLRTHGLGFLLYRIANQQRALKQYDEAVTTYDRLLELAARNAGKHAVVLESPSDPRRDDQPIEAVYVAASSVYRARCLFPLARYAEAHKALREPSAAVNPYQAEALRCLGDIALEWKGDAAAAAAAYSRALDVLADERPMDPRFAVPERSRTRTDAPPAMREHGDFGNIAWARLDPDRICNADNCGWYRDFERLQSQSKRALCAFISNRTTEAIADLDVITELDPDDAKLTARHMPSNYLRLRDGFTSGGLYASDRELAEFKGLPRVLLLIGDFAFEQEQWGEADLAYERLHRRFSEAINERALG
ncbi:MAG: hypothetical protein H0V44_07530 [Planctomycetes bacterium]|nr:hypothetical protein [Planctomycetota bacterium]